LNTPKRNMKPGLPPSLVTLTRHEVAGALGISLDCLDKMAADGTGPKRFRASPRTWRYRAADLEVWQAARIREAVAESKANKQAAA